MRYTATLTVPLQVNKSVNITFSPVVEVSLACHRCRRARRTIILSDSAPAKHFGQASNSDGHPFDGQVMSFASDTDHDAGVITARFELSYDFQAFIDAKYPERAVSPQPDWGRIHFTLRCACGRTLETFTQTNLVRPRNVHCECGQILFEERGQVVLFSVTKPDDKSVH